MQDIMLLEQFFLNEGFGSTVGLCTYKKPTGFSDHIKDILMDSSHPFVGCYKFLEASNTVEIHGEPNLFKKVAKKLEDAGFNVIIYY